MFYIVILLISVVIYMYFPETRGLTLEEVGRLLDDDDEWMSFNRSMERSLDRVRITKWSERTRRCRQEVAIVLDIGSCSLERFMVSQVKGEEGGLFFEPLERTKPIRRIHYTETSSLFALPYVVIQ